MGRDPGMDKKKKKVQADDSQIQSIVDVTEIRGKFDVVIAKLNEIYGTIKAGRASPNMIENVTVKIKGADGPVPLNSVAQVRLALMRIIILTTLFNRSPLAMQQRCWCRFQTHLWQRM